MSPPAARRLGHALFWPPLALWTWKLVEPHPVPEGLLQLLTSLDIAHYLAAKTLHLLGYAYLTVVLAVWVPRRRRPLVFALALVMLHGLASEVTQTFVPNRTGRALDVLIDWGGVAVGMAVGWRWWRPLFGRDGPTGTAGRSAG